jgi:predicted transcriptional regulator
MILSKLVEWIHKHNHIPFTVHKIHDFVNGTEFVDVYFTHKHKTAHYIRYILTTLAEKGLVRISRGGKNIQRYIFTKREEVIRILNEKIQDLILEIRASLSHEEWNSITIRPDLSSTVFG